jgi:hypothetical protein
MKFIPRFNTIHALDDIYFETSTYFHFRKEMFLWSVIHILTRMSFDSVL